MAVPGLREVREDDAALLALAVVGHEEQVVVGPGLALGLVGRSTLLERHLAEDAAQRDHGQALRLELDEEDAPGLARYERAQAFDLLDLGRVLRVNAELLGGVVEGQLFEVGRVDRPAQLVAEVGDELVEAGGCRRGVRGGRSASAQLSLSSIQHLSDGFTPTGASMRLR